MESRTLQSRQSLLESHCMEEKLEELKGKRIDVNCGTGAIFRGVVESVDEDLVAIKDEDGLVTNIAVKKIIAITECVDPITRPGFIV